MERTGTDDREVEGSEEESEDRPVQAPSQGHGRALSTLTWLALLGLAAFAFRGLFGYDPLAESRSNLEDADALFFSPTDSDPRFIFGLTLVFLYQRRSRLISMADRAPGYLLAAPFLAPGVMIGVWSYYVGAPELLVPSLSLMLLGSGALWGGRDGLRAVTVPALFLMLAYRPPGILINGVIHPLQMFVVETTRSILNTFGFPAFSTGDMVFTKMGIFHVIETCAGLRSIETLLMASVTYAEIMSCPRGRSVALVALSPLIGMVTNQIRVLSLVFNPYSSFASIHTLQGIVMIVVGVLLIAGLDWVLSRVAPGPTRYRTLPPLVGPVSDEPRSRRLLAIGGVLLLLGGASWVVGTWPQPSGSPPGLSFPVRPDGWKPELLALDKDFIGSVGYTEWLHRRYTKDDLEVTLFIGADDRLEPRVSLVSPKNAYLGAGWQIEREVPVTLDGGRTEARAIFQMNRGEAALVYTWYEFVESRSTEVGRAMAVLDRGPLRRPGRALVIRLSAPISRENPARAEVALEEFLPHVFEFLPEIRQPIP